MNWKVNTMLSDAARGDEKTDGPETPAEKNHKKKNHIFYIASRTYTFQLPWHIGLIVKHAGYRVR